MSVLSGLFLPPSLSYFLLAIANPTLTYKLVSVFCTPCQHSGTYGQMI